MSVNNNTKRETYTQYRQRIAAEQADLPREVVADRMERKSEFTVDLDNMPSQQHNWVDRGAVMSCEGAGHDNHHAWKRR